LEDNFRLSGNLSQTRANALIVSVLIAKSKDRLRELRVGISSKAVNRDFALSWDGPGLQQVDHKAQWPGASTIGERRLGGVLGVLLGRVYDIRKKPKLKIEKKELSAAIPPFTQTPPDTNVHPLANEPVDTHDSDASLSHIPEIVEGSPEDDWAGKDNDALNEAVLSPPTVTFNIDETAPANANGLELHPQNVASTSVEAEAQPHLVCSISLLIWHILWGARLSRYFETVY
jgi:hypothetical protein